MAHVPAAERRQQIIDAAIDVIGREGLAKATTRRIAERANAPLGALHYCFRDKEELMGLVLERGMETMQAAFDEVDPSAGLNATIQSSVDAYWQWVRDDPGLHFALMELLMWAIRLEGRSDNLYGTLSNPHGGDVLRGLLSEAAAADGTELPCDVDDLVRFVIHGFDGLLVEYAATEDADRCGRHAEMLAQALVAFCQQAKIAS